MNTKNIILKKIIFIFLILATFDSYSQVLKYGPQVLNFHSDVDDTEQPYSCYIPKDYNPKKEYALVVMLHGAGSNHRLAMRRVFGKSNAEGENDVEASLYFPKWKDVNYIVVSPYARGTMGYQGIAEKDVWDMITDVKKRFKIDENRTFLTGLSMGGGGTMWLGLTRPDFWAAIAPVCPAPPKETIDYLDNALNLKTYFFQGGADPVVKPEGTRQWFADFKKVGSNAIYKEYPGVKHDSWVNAYENELVFDWFDNIKRDPFPNRVKFTTKQLKYNKAYWLSIEDIVVGTSATIEGIFKMKNTLDIKTTNIKAFGINPNGHPNYNGRKSIRLNIDGQNLTVFGLNNGQILIKKNDKWMVEKKVENLNIKSKTLEGPMIESMASRHIYVYGTADNPSKEVLEERKKMAEKAADWSYYRSDFLGRVMVFPRVLADKEVRPNDMERSNLILFGTKATNSIISKNEQALPVELSENAVASSSLTYIYPNGKKYILVNSGLPFWEIPALDGGPFGSLRSAGKGGILSGYGDFVFYDKDLNNVISTGTFTNEWKLPDSEVAKLKSSGKINVK